MNTQSMQIVSTKDKDGKLKRHKPADTNIKAMSMGSWHASLSKGGEITAKGRARLAKGHDGGPVGATEKKSGKK